MGDDIAVGLIMIFVGIFYGVLAIIAFVILVKVKILKLIWS